jgi:putative DNA primase/helicase
MDAIEEFKGAMRANGLNPPEIIEPGKLHRFATNGKRHDDAGWCKLFADGVGGVFGDFRSGLSETWQAQREKSFTPAEREAFRQRCEAERRHAMQREPATMPKLARKRRRSGRPRPPPPAITPTWPASVFRRWRRCEKSRWAR